MNEHRTTWRLTKIPEQALFGLKLKTSPDPERGSERVVP